MTTRRKAAPKVADPFTADDDRRQALEVFAEVTGLPEVLRVIQRGREGARYVIELLDGREIRVPNAEALWSHSRMEPIIVEAISACTRQDVTAKEWRAVVRGIVLAEAIHVEEEEGERFEDTVREWILRYADRASTDRDGAARQGEPFREEGRLYLKAEELAKFVRREFAEQIKLPELRRALRDLGFQRTAVSYRRRMQEDARTTASYYHAGLDGLGGEVA